MEQGTVQEYRTQSPCVIMINEYEENRRSESTCRRRKDNRRRPGRPKHRSCPEKKDQEQGQQSDSEFSKTGLLNKYWTNEKRKP